LFAPVHTNGATYIPESFSLFNTKLQVCLSKGLGAPVGSVIVGSKAFIEKVIFCLLVYTELLINGICDDGSEQHFQAKILRKTLGGGMRQVGVLCAAAHVGVRDTVGKLADDHRRAKVLAGFISCDSEFN
jgi:threonine aldolase